MSHLDLFMRHIFHWEVDFLLVDLPLGEMLLVIIIQKKWEISLRMIPFQTGHTIVGIHLLKVINPLFASVISVLFANL